MAGQIAVITGAGSGIGRATAHALLDAGWNVVLAGRRRDMLEETAALAGEMPPRTLVVPTDIRDPVQVAGQNEPIRANRPNYSIVYAHKYRRPILTVNMTHKFFHKSSIR